MTYYEELREKLNAKQVHNTKYRYKLAAFSQSVGRAAFPPTPKRQGELKQGTFL